MVSFYLHIISIAVHWFLTYKHTNISPYFSSYSLRFDYYSFSFCVQFFHWNIFSFYSKWWDFDQQTQCKWKINIKKCLFFLPLLYLSMVSLAANSNIWKKSICWSLQQRKRAFLLYFNNKLLYAYTAKGWNMITWFDIRCLFLVYLFFFFFTLISKEKWMNNNNKKNLNPYIGSSETFKY